MISKKIIIGVLAVATIAALLLIIKKQNTAPTNGPVIGILQTASHPALNDARDGFVQTITQLMNEHVTIITYNAEGSITNAHSLAQRFHHNPSVKALYTIATPATQAVASVEKEKPIVFSAVTNAELLITDGQHNLCGVTDIINMHKEIEMLHTLLPNVKTVAVVYSTAEENSLQQVALIKRELQLLGLESIDVGISQESDIPTGLSLACRKADALICPTDNMLASAMDLVAHTALANKKPLIACHNQAVSQGALAARGVDYYACGKEAAHSMYRVIIQGKTPSDVSVKQAVSDTIFVNKKTLDTLGLTIPESLQDQVKLV